jgi:serine/threonine protein kinase
MLVQPNGVLKLVDFDSVLRLGDRRISHHEIGTFGYAAPEIMNGAVDPDVRADIFAMK